jgi:HPt (histidine-containing phosphotransfer) domain-containing protein
MNFRELAEQMEMEEGELLEIIGFFLEASASDLGKIQSAVEEEDAQKAFRAAHSIKGAAANLRLTAICELAQRMETEARENRLDGAIGAIRAIQENLNQLDESLKRETQRPEDAKTKGSIHV